MSEFTIKQIFIDHWDNFIIDNPNIYIRPSVFDEVNKIIHCGDLNFGHAIYVCDCCHKILTVPFRCKSRFCNTCGTKYAQDRAFTMAKKAILLIKNIALNMHFFLQLAFTLQNCIYFFS